MSEPIKIRKHYRKWGTCKDLKYIGAHITTETLMVIESYSYNHRGEQISYGEAIERMVQDLKQISSTQNTFEKDSSGT